MSNYLKSAVTALAMAASVLTCSAQGARGAAPLKSTVVNPDGTVTFNYRNDNASDVKVDVQFAGRHDMHRGGDGVWTVTLGPAEPDMYPYCFIVDGVSVMDPLNPDWFPNEGFKNSILDIRGDTPSDTLGPGRSARGRGLCHLLVADPGAVCKRHSLHACRI